MKGKEGRNNLQSEHRVIISGGGTGGHIFPAIAIANALKSIDPSINILFVGAEGKMEMEKVPAAGYPIEGLPVTGFQRSLKVSNLAFPFRVLRSLWKAGTIINRFKPQVAVGVGGYASGPLLYMASWKGVPGLIQEQNSFPGVTNKLLAAKVEKICVAYDRMERFFPASKVILTGNPVRENMVVTEGKKSEAAAYFKLDTSKPTLLVIGGSQGARSINLAVKAHLDKIVTHGVQLIWQSGPRFYEEASQVVASVKDKGIRAYDFISRMDLAYAMGDVIISRAGASTVSELCIIGKPAILVPLPTAAEDHQTHNCKALVEKNAAILVMDIDAMSNLVETALQLITDHEKKNILGANISRLAIRDSAKIIAQHVLSIIKN
ncbi:MAG: undecaprenyldiphospho-muramoylpentapeptide beta-N-acetylglucosaminyltransferase [Bacteroidota bacterium]|nr:undecaprenyldiphospho-muramoylpentapeptide beta-N-acetylglucosaminyltransferase [Bacteroidota bacterium]